MKKERTSSGLNWVYAQGSTLLILLLPACWYSLSYVPAQKDYFIQRNFRLLAIMSENLESRVENSALTLKNLASTAASYSPESAQQWIQAAIELVPGLELREKPAVLELTNLTAVASNSSPAVKFLHEPELGLRFDCEGVVGQDSPRRVLLRAKRDFMTLIPPREEFDALLIAQEDGTVIFQRSNVGWKVLQLGQLTDDAGNSLKTNLSRKASSVAEVNCAGSHYKVFLQPVTISVPSGSEQVVNWWVCGMVKSHRFLLESLAVSRRVMVGFIFLVLAAAVSLPFLKIRFMGPQAPLRPSDIFFISVATILGSVLSAYLLLDLFAYSRAEGKFNGQLKSLARRDLPPLHERSASRRAAAHRA
jgi:uncharacterized membrane protein YwzB